MPFINLIHEQRVAARREERKSKTLFLAFVGVMVASVGGFVVGSFESSKLSDEEASLQAQIQRAEPLIRRTEQNDRLKAELAPRVKTLEDAHAASQRWARVLDYFTTQTPPDTYLTSIRCTAGDAQKPVSLALSGIATRQEPVGELILRLQNCEDLENVGLKFTQEKLIDMAKATEFMVEGDLAGTVAKKNISEEKS
jgi:Tfp pilus assembly protein PilN